jgi:hypothetical protein
MCFQRNAASAFANASGRPTTQRTDDLASFARLCRHHAEALTPFVVRADTEISDVLTCKLVESVFFNPCNGPAIPPCAFGVKSSRSFGVAFTNVGKPSLTSCGWRGASRALALADARDKIRWRGPPQMSGPV